MGGLAAAPAIPGGREARRARPERATPYALRHSSITRMLLRAVPVRVVADLHDTSRAPDRGALLKHIAHHADDVARAALIDLGQPPTTPDNVVPLKR